MVLPICFVMIKMAASQYLGQVAQLVEHGPEKAGVGGSSPAPDHFLASSWLTSGREAPKKSVFCGFSACIGFLPASARDVSIQLTEISASQKGV